MSYSNNIFYSLPDAHDLLLAAGRFSGLTLNNVVPHRYSWAETFAGVAGATTQATINLIKHGKGTLGADFARGIMFYGDLMVTIYNTVIPTDHYELEVQTRDYNTIGAFDGAAATRLYYKNSNEGLKVTSKDHVTVTFAGIMLYTIEVKSILNATGVSSVTLQTSFNGFKISQ